jgi:hypothetical protein
MHDGKVNRIFAAKRGMTTDVMWYDKNGHGRNRAARATIKVDGYVGSFTASSFRKE